MLHHDYVEPKTTPKTKLPPPYDQDLSGVLQHLSRRTALSKAGVANDPVTAAYLAAAMRLLERDLGPVADRLLDDLEDESSLEEPLIRLLSPFLSQRAVVAEVGNNPEPFSRHASVAGLRSRWMSQSDFIADLLKFVTFYRASAVLSESTAVVDQKALISGSNPSNLDQGASQTNDKPRRAELRPGDVSERSGDDLRRSNPSRHHPLQSAISAACIGWRALIRAVMPQDALTVLRSDRTDLQARALVAIEIELDHAYAALGPPPGVEGTSR